MLPSAEVRMSPPRPTATKVLFTYWTPRTDNTVPEVLGVQVVPTVEERTVPE